MNDHSADRGTRSTCRYRPRLSLFDSQADAAHNYGLMEWCMFRISHSFGRSGQSVDGGGPVGQLVGTKEDLDHFKG